MPYSSLVPRPSHHAIDQKLDSGKAWEQGYYILNVLLSTASVKIGEQRFPSHDEVPLFSM